MINLIKSAPAAKLVLAPLDEIEIPLTHRPTHADKVGELVKSIQRLGLQAAPVVTEHDGRYRLVSGRHRIEAFRVMGEKRVPVRVVEFDEIEARLWTISENLHRNDLTALQRSEQIAEFARLTREKPAAQKLASAEVKAEAAALIGKVPDSREEVSAQVGPKPQGGRPESGDRLAARGLGVTRQEVQRSQAIASLPSEVKAKAADLGLDGNQSALLAAAKSPTIEAQLSALEQRAVRTVAPIVSRPPSLRNLENIAAGELAKWIKATTPNDRLRVIDILRRCADILEDELNAEQAA
jgi:ParB family transcriptional regulator, chromosome partitioning protein